MFYGSRQFDIAQSHSITGIVCSECNVDAIIYVVQFRVMIQSFGFEGHPNNETDCLPEGGKLECLSKTIILKCPSRALIQESLNVFYR